MLGSAANVAYHARRLRPGRPARPGRPQRATDAEGSWRCLSALALADLGRGAYGEVVEHALAAAALATRSSENLGVAALAATYAGDLDQARELNDRMAAAAVSPTLRAFAAYISGEIDSAAGHPELADEQYTRAIDLARSSGATFLIGIASVGLVTVLADAGRVHRSAARLPRRHRLLGPIGQLDPAMGDLAQPRPAAAPTRR